MALPESHLDVDILNGRYTNGTGVWEELFDYDDVQYHLRLDSTSDGNGIQDSYLEKLERALDGTDEDEIENQVEECRALMWPLVKTDYSSRTHKPDEIVRIQGTTIDGQLQSITHNSYLLYSLTNPVPNTFPRVHTFSKDAITHSEEITHDIFKVKIFNKNFVMKTVHRTGNEHNFIREISILQYCSHRYIIKLLGLVINSNYQVEGMLLEHILNAKSLQQVSRVTFDELGKWRSQISEAVEYLHSMDYVWGDAKSDNILIRENGDIVLIDFGDGATANWVDQENYESVKGDLEACKRIINFITEKVGK